MLSIVYLSSASSPFSGDDLSALLESSRRNNMLTNLTGMLLHREGRFLQVLEGPEVFVRARMAVIAADPRHTGIRMLHEEKLPLRRFPHWTMHFESVTPARAGDVPGLRRMFADVGRDDGSGDQLRTLEGLLRWFQERAVPAT
ncbi:hypothetical protein GM708_07625 [Vibrio cholerae]|nr:hypothetical protein [Vibrio cholerae]